MLDSKKTAKRMEGRSWSQEGSYIAMCLILWLCFSGTFAGWDSFHVVYFSCYPYPSWVV